MVIICSWSFYTNLRAQIDDEAVEELLPIELEDAVEESDEAEIEAESKKEQSGVLRVDQLTRRERRNLERMLTMNEHILYRGETPYVRDWSFRSGVVELNVPAYDGWINVTKKKDLYLSYARQGLPGQTLSGVYVNSRYISATKSNYINFYVLCWVPERFAYSLFNPERFEPLKEKLHEELIAIRKETTNREDFRTFDDYFNFKFGKDEELEDFVDGRLIKALEEEDFISYFFTSEFLINDETSPVTEPMLGTTTFGLVREKLIRFDIRMPYRAEDDVSRILDFTQQFFDDMKRVNSTEKEKRR